VVDVHEEIVAAECQREPIVQPTSHADGVISAVIDENLGGHGPAESPRKDPKSYRRTGQITMSCSRGPVGGLAQQAVTGLIETPHRMSALPPKADIGTQSWNVRFVPKAHIDLLIDHLVGAGKQCRWHRDAESLGGLKIDGQFILGWCLHRHLGRLFALENTVNVSRCAPVWID